MTSNGWFGGRKLCRIALGACLSFAVPALAACSSSAAPSAAEPSEDDDERDDDPPSKSRADAGGKDTATSGSKRDASVGSKRTDDAGSVRGGGSASDGAGWCKAKVVLEKHCTSCHDGEGTAGAPMGLASFDDTQADAPLTKGKKVYETIATRIHDSKRPMPPAGNMSDAEIAALDAWIEAGARQGDDVDCGASPPEGDDAAQGSLEPQWPEECTEKYRYKIVAHAPGSATTPVRVARGTETHPQVAIDAPWGSEPVQALAMRSITDNKKVLHHWILYANSGAFITGWAPGKEDKDPLPDDVGMFLPSGPRSMRLDMHYFNTTGTQDENDMSGVEICAVPKALWRKNTATVTMGFAALGVGFVLAPANTKGHEATGSCRVTATQPVHLLTASPHAHTHARAMRFTVTKASGEKVTLHEGPFNFEEQRSYPMKQDVILRTGDTVTTTCIFDNDTNRNITFGESTTNEMCFNFALYYPMGALSCGLGLPGLGG